MTLILIGKFLLIAKRNTVEARGVHKLVDSSQKSIHMQQNFSITMLL